MIGAWSFGPFLQLFFGLDPSGTILCQCDAFLRALTFKQSLEEKYQLRTENQIRKILLHISVCTQVRKEAFMAFFSGQSYLHSYLLVPCQTDHHFLSAFFHKRRRRRKYIVRQDCNWSIFFLSHLFPTQHHSYISLRKQKDVRER